ncbi:MAG: DUF4101 domain-containing protein [Symploca sp. SIO2E9]|nr:DUF4101 domain-containing protein [Symploca sp. SIO2E9]
MRIPLDYYRILGLPIQANATQLSQAHGDRILQLPRREYSEAAIKSRKQLLDEAYEVLSEPEQRHSYDASFLTKTYEQQPEQKLGSRSQASAQATEGLLEPHTPSLEIRDEQLIGALLILQELGEYEIVLKLGQTYLGTDEGASIDHSRLGEPQIVRADLVLTLGLACLELGREQWQQGQYENAATALETGQELLLKEGLFPALRGEIQADLYKLRPYRILELLALPEENIAKRRKGLQKLQDMLQERGGIDGTGDDQSGLSIDDFLRFIQQLRVYLSSTQQQNLFEAEAKRPSAVATYLAVYALLARGFAQRQPALISRAKQMLMRLGKRQDVHLEQSVCALLLGQTEEASRALELSQEYEPLAFIREHSQGSPDLLPGLCLYGERWLQKSVFPHFRDLCEQKASLKEYFADEQVQAYLEELPESSADSPNEWAVVQSGKKAYARSVPSNGFSETAWSSKSNYQPNSAVNGQHSKEKYKDLVSESVVAASRWKSTPEAATITANRQATVGKTSSRSNSSAVSTLPAAQRIAPSTPVSDSAVKNSPDESVNRSKRRQRQQRKSDELAPTHSLRNDSELKVSSDDQVQPLSLPPASLQNPSEKSKSLKKVKKRIFFGILSLLAFWLIWLVLSQLSKALRGTPKLEAEQPLVGLAEPPVVIPESGTRMLNPEGPLSEETAKQVIEIWLEAKSSAYGRDYNLEELEDILVDPALSYRRQGARAAQQNNSYWLYNHAVVVNSVVNSDFDQNQATVDAAVNEDAQYYQGGQLDEFASYNENLRVRYDLVRQEGMWFIQDMAVVR